MMTSQGGLSQINISLLLKKQGLWFFLLSLPLVHDPNSCHLTQSRLHTSLIMQRDNLVLQNVSNEVFGVLLGQQVELQELKS